MMTENKRTQHSEETLFNFRSEVPFSQLRRPETPFLTKRRNTMSFTVSNDCNQNLKPATLQPSQHSKY
jgi:hypothetical protein